jgi:hypothetical protein
MREALGSMALTGAHARLGGIGALVLGGAAILPIGLGKRLRVTLACGAALSAGVAIASELYTRAALKPERSGRGRQAPARSNGAARPEAGRQEPVRGN